MATIQQRCGSYRVLIRLSGRAPVSRTFDSRAKAEEWAALETAKMRRQRAGQRVRMLVEEAITKYRAEVLPRKRPGTWRAQSAHLDYWTDVLGHVRLDQLSPALLVECREHLCSTRDDGEAGGRSRATVNRYLATMGHVIETARREWGVELESNPVRMVSRLPEPQGRVRFLSDEERSRLLEAAATEGGEDLRLAVLVAITTGMRRQEQLTLRWRDVDLERRLITLHATKTGRRRGVPVPRPAIEALRERARGKLAGDLVWPSPVDPGKPITFGQSWRRTVKRAGLEDFRWHDMRHTAASYLAMSGASLRDLAEILGHQTLAMVQRYSHLTATHTIEVVDRMTDAKGIA